MYRGTSVVFVQMEQGIVFQVSTQSIHVFLGRRYGIVPKQVGKGIVLRISSSTRVTWRISTQNHITVSVNIASFQNTVTDCIVPDRIDICGSRWINDRSDSIPVSKSSSKSDTDSCTSDHG